jgi:chromosome segregation ATPase
MLKKKVEEATNDLIKQTDALDRMRTDHVHFSAPADPTATDARSTTYEINRLRKQLIDYEKELSERDIRLHDLDVQLRGFLDKNYELRDAVQEIRQLKEQLKLKDRQLEDLAQFASRNELTVHEVNDENEELRAKLGMDPRTPMTVEQLKTARMTRSEANQAVVQVLQKEVREFRIFNRINKNLFYRLNVLKKND